LRWWLFTVKNKSRIINPLRVYYSILIFYSVVVGGRCYIDKPTPPTVPYAPVSMSPGLTSLDLSMPSGVELFQSTGQHKLARSVNQQLEVSKRKKKDVVKISN
jgi:hypothetical protein